MKALDSFANVVLVISFFLNFQHDVKLGFIIFLFMGVDHRSSRETPTSRSFKSDRLDRTNP